ncbi:TraX family protein [Achromobacter spanius]|uniref:TraX family protein n=1 Tax=Achromobacter spanius TaxID=217203 RepID=UPI00382D1873
MKPATASIKAFDARDFVIANGTLEGLKLLALALMTIDHINKYLFKGASVTMFNMGRLAFPIFAFVLAYNLARPGALHNGSTWRILKRLAGFGVLASPVFIALGGLIDGWWPLNIMLTFALGVGVVALSAAGGIGNIFAAGAAFVVGGALVEFWWPGVAVFFLAWSYCRWPTLAHLLLLTLASASLVIINGNYWAVAAVPVVMAARYVDLPIARHRFLFYAYYPAHLAAIWLVRHYFF